jgi:DNA uptake protein ComE-like DNA-binding protein
MATQVDAVLKVEGADGTSRPLSTLDFETGRTGAATETTLAEVLAELGGKLEPADLATLATAANQAAAKNVLDAINTALGVPAGSNTALALLTTIAANTGTETTTVQQLSLTADQVQLNTDTLEALLTTLNGLVGGAAIPVNLPGSSGAVTAVDGRLMGFSARETTGTASAFFRLRAGTGTGTILATVSLAANESVRDWFAPNGIQATGGVYYELVSGAVAGGVQTR